MNTAAAAAAAAAVVSCASHTVSDRPLAGAADLQILRAGPGGNDTCLGAARFCPCPDCPHSTQVVHASVTQLHFWAVAGRIVGKCSEQAAAAVMSVWQLVAVALTTTYTNIALVQVEPLLEVLVGKCLEQGLMEVMEEEELAAMRAHQQHYEQVCSPPASLLASQLSTDKPHCHLALAIRCYLVVLSRKQLQLAAETLVKCHGLLAPAIVISLLSRPVDVSETKAEATF